MSGARAGPSERVNVIHGLLLLAAFAAFVGYYSLCSFKVPWIGDESEELVLLRVRKGSPLIANDTRAEATTRGSIPRQER